MKEEKKLSLTITKNVFDDFMKGLTNVNRKLIFNKGSWLDGRVTDKNGHLKHFDIVHAKTSYNKNAPFFIADIEGIERLPDGRIFIDIGLVHEYNLEKQNK